MTNTHSTPFDIKERFQSYLDSMTFAEARRLGELALAQSPKVLVVSCCDSRVDPTTLLKANPGEVFTVRNVANVVPPFESDNHYHGTSAAIEYAVSVLKIPHVMVLGHSNCGGVAAACSHEISDDFHFISHWLDNLHAPVKRVKSDHPDISSEKLCHHVEKASVEQSIDNLHSFPFVKSALEEGWLTLTGAWFDIGNNDLQLLDVETGRFNSTKA